MRHHPLPRLSVLLLAAASAPSLARAGGADLLRVSVSSGGVEGNSASGPGQDARLHAVSGDGRYVAFLSQASNLVSGDSNNRRDVFRRDLQTGTTVRVSVGASGQQGDGDCLGVAISADGRFVAYSSESANLVAGDGNGLSDVFVWDAQTGTSQCASLTPGGATGNGASTSPALSQDGARVAFASRASDLVAGDGNGFLDVFLRDRLAGTTSLVSATPGGNSGNGESDMPALSANGQVCAFSSGATDLGPTDPHNLHDVYVRDYGAGTMQRVTKPGVTFNGESLHPSLDGTGRWVAFQSAATNIVGGTVSIGNVFLFDRQTGGFDLVSITPTGVSGDGASFDASISEDGKWVAFQSAATNLIAGDTNGTYDVFVRRVDHGWTERVSESESGGQLAIASRSSAISANGRHCVFHTPDQTVVSGDSNGTYDVFVHDRGYGTGEVGAVYCTSNPNSTGATASLSITGSQVVTDQSLLLASGGLPNNVLGYYLMSETQAHVPFFGGSEGVLCVGGTIYRLNAYVLSSGGTGSMSLQLPFGGLPTGVTLDAGEMWSFQLWYRDKVGGTWTSNTSDGVCVFLH